MRRREFLGAATAAALFHTIPLAARAAGAPAWTLGFEGVTDDLPREAMSSSGELPDACRGTFYRNGPARYARGGRRYEHWFDPDGMIQAFRLTPARVTHEGRFVRTAKFRAEEQAGRFLYSGAGTQFDAAMPARNNESTNVANINIQAFNGELLALWEAGGAHRIDPRTLETRGLLDLGRELAGVPFSAHPRFDEDGNLWNIGSVPFAGRPLLVLYHLAASGALHKSRLHELDFPGYMHDFVLTQRYLVALNSSAVFGAGETFVDRMRWENDRPSQLLVFDRNDFELVATIEIPPVFVFHFGNGHDAGAHIEFTASAYDDLSLVQSGMRRLARQEAGDYGMDARLLRYRLDLGRGTADVVSLGVNLEFPSFNRDRPFVPQPILGVGGGGGSESTLPSAILRVDPSSGAVSRFDYGPGIIVEEPLFVPGPRGGYALHSYLDYRRRRSGVAVLAEASLEDGPVFRAEMDRVLPLGFHGCFVAQSRAGQIA